MQRYEHDFNAWAAEQARFLRAVRFDLLDVPGGVGVFPGARSPLNP